MPCRKGRLHIVNYGIVDVEDDFTARDPLNETDDSLK